MKGKTGGSMSGRIIRTNQRYEFNEEICSICFASSNSPCIKLQWENRGRGYRYETHRTSVLKLKLTLPLSDQDKRKIAKKR